jgi:hypothetical protein
MRLFTSSSDRRQPKSANRHSKLPASHTGVADVPSTLFNFQAIVWIALIIKSSIMARQTQSC